MLAAGFWLSFAVTLAYLTSHGSAWLSPVAERLKMQWLVGRALSLSAAVLFGSSFVVGVSAGPPSFRNRWWLVLPLVGMGLVVLDLSFLGITP